MLKNDLINKIMFFFGVLCILAGVVSALLGNAASGTVVIVTGLALIMLSQFEIETIKLLGLEAKLRRTLNEAEIILEKLKGISIPISQSSISLAARTGRLDTATSHKELYELVNKITMELRGMQVSENEIQQVKSEWVYFTAFDMGRVIIDSLLDILHVKNEIARREVEQWVGGKPVSDHEKYEEMLKPVQQTEREIQTLRKCLWKKAPENFPFIIDNLISESKTLSDDEKALFKQDHKEWWDDLTYFVTNKDIRRPHIWFGKEV